MLSSFSRREQNKNMLAETCRWLCPASLMLLPNFVAFWSARRHAGTVERAVLPFGVSGLDMNAYQAADYRLATCMK